MADNIFGGMSAEERANSRAFWLDSARRAKASGASDSEILSASRGNLTAGDLQSLDPQPIVDTLTPEDLAIEAPLATMPNAGNIHAGVSLSGIMDALSNPFSFNDAPVSPSLKEDLAANREREGTNSLGFLPITTGAGAELQAALSENDGLVAQSLAPSSPAAPQPVGQGRPLELPTNLSDPMVAFREAQAAQAAPNSFGTIDGRTGAEVKTPRTETQNINTGIIAPPAQLPEAAPAQPTATAESPAKEALTKEVEKAVNTNDPSKTASLVQAAAGGDSKKEAQLRQMWPSLSNFTKARLVVGGLTLLAAATPLGAFGALAIGGEAQGAINRAEAQDFAGFNAQQDQLFKQQEAQLDRQNRLDVANIGANARLTAAAAKAAADKEAELDKQAPSREQLLDIAAILVQGDKASDWTPFNELNDQELILQGSQLVDEYIRLSENNRVQVPFTTWFAQMQAQQQAQQ